MCKEDLDKRMCDVIPTKLTLTQTFREWIHIVDMQVYGQPCISDSCLDAMSDEELTEFVDGLKAIDYLKEVQR